MLKPSKSKHLGMKRPSSPNGFVSVDRILSEKAEIHFKKVYDRKCKQQQDERINSVDDLAVSTEPYDINLLDRKFYYNADGTDNLYDGPEEIAAKLGLEYKGSHIVAVLLSTRKFHASRGSSVAVNISKQRTARASIASGAIITSSGSSSLPQSPSKVVTERAIPKDDKLKNAGVLTRITLAAYKEERRRKVLGTWSALKQ
ncbi:hypothetical protein PS15p_211535 [Mucor circinelloides]